MQNQRLNELKDEHIFKNNVQSESILKLEKISLENLSFKYPNIDKYVLKDVNLTINNRFKR